MKVANNNTLIRKRFFEIFVITLLFKIFISAKIPITGDEALFFVWSRDLSWGYYDHPPMIAWMLALFSKFSTELFVIRFPAAISNHIISLGIIYLLKRIKVDPIKSYLIGMIYLLLPISLLNVLVTNDVALTIFLFGSVYFFALAKIREEKLYKNNYLFYAISGIFFGMSFLSKYLVVIIFAPYLFLFIKDKKWKEAVIFCTSLLPFIAINYVWNINNCWQNIQFNLVNRLEDKVAPWLGISTYLFIIAYVFTPWFVYFLFKNKSKIKLHLPIYIIAILPFVLFAILSLRQLIGLHWVQPFIPAMMIVGGLLIDGNDLKKTVRWNILFTLNHAIIILILIFTPITAWQNFKIYEKFSLLKYSNEVSKLASKSMPPNTILMTKGYSTSGIFAYYLNSAVPVFGIGSKFGRHDDLNFNFREIDGKNIRIFDNSTMNIDEFKPFFTKIILTDFELRGVRYWYVDGENFNYESYRELVLKKIAQKYYKLPDFLPSSQCPFLDKNDLN